MRGAQNSPWDEGLELELCRLWKEGYSGGQIAERIGMTRCAVLGKISRLGLQRSGSRPPRPVVPRAKQRRTYMQTLKQPAEPAPVQQPRRPRVRSLTLLQLGEHSCRWPVLDPPPEFKFCGAYRDRGDPYCAFHMDKAFHKTRR